MTPSASKRLRIATYSVSEASCNSRRIGNFGRRIRTDPPPQQRLAVVQHPEPRARPPALGGFAFRAAAVIGEGHVGLVPIPAERAPLVQRMQGVDERDAARQRQAVRDGALAKTLQRASSPKRRRGRPPAIQAQSAAISASVMRPMIRLRRASAKRRSRAGRRFAALRGPTRAPSNVSAPGPWPRGDKPATSSCGGRKGREDTGVSKIALVGLGLVGRAWAVSFARAGHEVAIWDERPEAIDDALRLRQPRAARPRRHDLLRGEPPLSVRSRMRRAGSLEEALDGREPRAGEHARGRRDQAARVRRARPARRSRSGAGELDLGDPAVDLQRGARRPRGAASSSTRSTRPISSRRSRSCRRPGPSARRSSAPRPARRAPATRRS